MTPSIALLPAGETIEDFLEPLSLSFDDYCEMNGGWGFGYVEALHAAGVRTVVVCVSKDVEQPVRAVHRPTGATIWRLPQPRVNALLHRGARSLLPYDCGREASLWRRALRSPMRHLAWVLSTPVRHLAALLRHERCDAILCQDYEQPRFDACILTGRALDLPVIGSFQGADAAMSLLERPLRPRTIRSAAGLIAGPQAEVARVRARYRLGPDRVSRIFNPLDLTPWGGVSRTEARARLGLAADAWVVGWHGRVERHKKGLDILLDAWERLCRAPEEREGVLLLLGTGKDATWLRREITDRRLTGVQWLDEYILDKREIAWRLAAADVYAFPSRLEGFPVAPVEAMACGLPVVAANAHGVSDIFENGEAYGGIVVPVGDFRAMADALARVRCDGDLARELGHRARRRAEDAFSPPAVGAELRATILGAREARP